MKHITNDEFYRDVVLNGATLEVIVHNGEIINIANPKRSQGYAVSIKGHELRTEIISPSILQAYIETHRNYLQDNDNAYVGIWQSGAYWYLDISKVYSNVYNAIDEANYNKQIAIYSFSTGKSYKAMNMEEIK